MNDDQLRRLLSDAVSDIEPEDRIDELRAKVHPSPQVVPMARSRSWYAAAGIVATAAVIGVIAYLTSVAGTQTSEIGPAGEGGTALPTVIATDTAAPQPGSSTSAAKTVPVYYLGHGPRGSVLFRQSTAVAPGLDPLQAAVSSLMAHPYDPDYRLAWSPGWLRSAVLEDGVIRVELGAVPATRPAGMSGHTAYEVVQSAVYTLQAVTHSRATVRFERSGRTVSAVLGVRTDRPVVAGRPSTVLSRVSLTRPAVDGQRSHDGRLVVSGTADEPLGTVVVRLVSTGHAGERTVRRQTVLTGGTGDAFHRFRWRVVLETSSLRGTYTVVARAGGPSGDTDSRVVVIR